MRAAHAARSASLVRQKGAGGRLLRAARSAARRSASSLSASVWLRRRMATVEARWKAQGRARGRGDFAGRGAVAAGSAS